MRLPWCTADSSGGWVVQDLLSKSFRTQMLMDGQFGSISFVATKTDDINASETIDSLATVSRLLSPYHSQHT